MGMGGGPGSGTPTFPPINRPIPWQVDFINNSTIVSDSDFLKCVSALQKQCDQHFSPVWNIAANVKASTTLNQTPTIFVLDVSSDIGILGYHDITAAGIPVGFIFAKTTIESGETWTSCASHELLELLGDPYVNLAAQGQFVGGTAFFAYETCDAVQSDVYEIDGVEVSNFQYPQWFVNQTADKYDFMGVLEAPFTLSAGGYFSYFRTVGDWIDVSAAGVLPILEKQKWSRYFRRRYNADPGYLKVWQKLRNEALKADNPHRSID